MTGSDRPHDEPSDFRSPWWLPGAHLQTIVPALFAREAAVRYRRERWDTPDGDFIDVDRTVVDPAVDAASDPGSRPTLVVFHGLEGSAQSRYVRSLMAEAVARGWHGIAPHFRGCGGTLNRRPRFYHSGDSPEVDWILRRVAAERHASQGSSASHGSPPSHPSHATLGSHRSNASQAPHAQDETRDAGQAGLRAPPLFVVGISLGGNMLLKWLGEHGVEAADVVTAAAAVSAPMDLTAGGTNLGRGVNRLYAKMFLRSLKAKGRAKLVQHPDLFDRARMEAARDLHAFDDVVTAPLHGYRDTDDYWSRASAKPLLGAIAVPTLLLNARNDPFLPERALPRPDEVSSCVTFDFPRHGGHVGFVDAGPDGAAWMPRRVVRYLAARAAVQAASEPETAARSAPAPGRRAAVAIIRS